MDCGIAVSRGGTEVTVAGRYPRLHLRCEPLPQRLSVGRAGDAEILRGTLLVSAGLVETVN